MVKLFNCTPSKQKPPIEFCKHQSPIHWGGFTAILPPTKKNKFYSVYWFATKCKTFNKNIAFINNENKKCVDCVYLNEHNQCWAIKKEANPKDIMCDYRIIII